MSIRAKISRWRMGAGLHDRATAAVALAAISEDAGRERAWAFVRDLHAEHPNPQRVCTIPDCCATPPTEDGAA